jgi:hypothetical protein
MTYLEMQMWAQAATTVILLIGVIVLIVIACRHD